MAAGLRRGALLLLLLAPLVLLASFAPFGQVIASSPDGDQFGPNDAQLDLSRGIPRFYIMRLENQPLQFYNLELSNTNWP